MVYVGLGSNQQQPAEQIRAALSSMGNLPGCRGLHASSLYRTQPIGPAGQPDYINAVAGFHTSLPPEALLAELNRIEQVQGRVRTDERWGPRTLDLDLLLYGQHRQLSSVLEIPHPRMAQREFVLRPLADIAPLDILIPGYGRLGDLLALNQDQGVCRLD